LVRVVQLIAMKIGFYSLLKNRFRLSYALCSLDQKRVTRFGCVYQT
jgi:hypothetical protein